MRARRFVGHQHLGVLFSQTLDVGERDNAAMLENEAVSPAICTRACGLHPAKEEPNRWLSSTSTSTSISCSSLDFLLPQPGPAKPRRVVPVLGPVLDLFAARVVGVVAQDGRNLLSELLRRSVVYVA